MDYTAHFDGTKWEVCWNWEVDPPRVSPSAPEYKIRPGLRAAFDNEIATWVRDGILMPWSQERHGNIRNTVPLMAVEQCKGATTKVRPVLDFRRLNQSIVSRPGFALPLCQARLREWRKYGLNCSVVDLQKAYLQVFVAPELWTYQAVQWCGKTYLLTRLGFGLCVTPKIMTAIIEWILGQEKDVAVGTSSYIDDILVREDVVNVDKVMTLLRQFGLKTKSLVKLS